MSTTDATDPGPDGRPLDTDATTGDGAATNAPDQGANGATDPLPTPQAVAPARVRVESRHVSPAAPGAPVRVRQMSDLIAAGLKRHGVRGGPWTELTLVNPWLPPADAGLDDRWPRLPELRERFDTAREEVDATKKTVKDAERHLEGVRRLRATAAAESIDAPMPSARDAEEAIEAARLRFNGAVARFAEASVEIYMEARELSPSWVAAMSAAIAEAEEVKREAEERLRDATTILATGAAGATLCDLLTADTADPRKKLMSFAILQKRLADQALAPDPRIAAHDQMQRALGGPPA